MKKNKKDIIQFLVWTRNGIAFCTCWFLILILIYNYYYDIQSITTDSLMQMLFFVAGGVLLFSTFFTRLFIRKWRFVSRFTGFIILISIYECIAFYCMGFFVKKGSVAEWLGFIGIVLILYLLCIAIYQLYSRKKGKLYTQALENYQHKRSIENGK